METEIRAAFTRISRPAGNQQGGASAGVNGNRDNPPAVRLITLMSVLRPLLVRDGRLLVQAAANVLRRVENPGGAATGDNGGNVFVALATANKHGTAQAAGDKVCFRRRGNIGFVLQDIAVSLRLERETVFWKIGRPNTAHLESLTTVKLDACVGGGREQVLMHRYRRPSAFLCAAWLEMIILQDAETI